MINLLEDLQEQLGLTYLLISHSGGAGSTPGVSTPGSCVSAIGPSYAPWSRIMLSSWVGFVSGRQVSWPMINSSNSSYSSTAGNCGNLVAIDCGAWKRKPASASASIAMSLYESPAAMTR